MRDVNVRGTYLKMANFSITDHHEHMLRKPVENTFTPIGPYGVPRQIDFLLASKEVRGWTRDCETTKAIDMGSDHKTLTMRANLQ